MEFSRIGKVARDAWVIVGITIFLFCLLEVSLSLALFISTRFRGSGLSDPDHRAMADAYADKSWVSDYYEELRQADAIRWMPYVYWRREPHRGVHINVDTRGIRRTIESAPGQLQSGTPVSIFMFGGSTLWGTGSRDGFTIPSALTRELQRKGIAAEIVNFGESGYVSTQEVITLMLRLQAGDVPDLVIFYDGVNDTYSAYQQRVAGLPQNEFNRTREFNVSKPENYQERRAIFLRETATRLAAVRVLKSLLPTWGESSGIARNPIVAALPSERAPLAQEVVDRYAGNLALVEALGDEYGFKYLFYWQPTIFQKAHLTAYESAERNSMRTVEPFFLKTHEVVEMSGLAKKSGNTFRDLSLVFSDVRQPLYIDWCHLGERGNEMIAQRMADDVSGAITTVKAAAEQANATNR